VRDPWASRSFHAAVLGFMGYREVADHDRGFDYDRAGRPRAAPRILGGCGLAA
jgi:hypothetical protein